MEEVEALCSTVCIMDHGRIIAAGTKDEIIASLGGQFTIHVTLGKADDTLVKKLGDIDCVSTLSTEGADILIVVEAGDQSAKKILEAIVQSDADLLGFDIEKANLETVFLNLTGRALRD